MPTDALSGGRYPSSGAVPNVAVDIQNAVNDLSKVAGGIFTTASARDTAFTNWVNAGNSMTDGLTCRVAGFPQVYRGGSWHGASSQFFTTSTTDTTRHTTTAAVMTLTVTDPGFSYKILGWAQVLVATVEASTTVSMRVRVNGTDLPGVGADWTNNTGGTLTNGVIGANASPSGVLTGAATVQAVVWLTGSNGFSAGSPSLYNQLTALVVPA